MFDLITIGDGTNDIFLRPHEASLVDAPSCPKGGVCQKHLICWNYGEKILIDSVLNDVGGSACNVAVGLSRLGIKSAMISALGPDNAGEKVMARLVQEGVDASSIKINAKIQTSFSVIINYKTDRTILVYHGLEDYSKLPIGKKLNSSWAYISPLGNNYQSVYKKLITLASEKNLNIALNPGSRQIQEMDPIFKSLLRVSKILFLNKEEAEQIINPNTNQNLEKVLLERLKDLGPEIVVMTDGPQGAYLFDGKNYLKIKAIRSEVTDSTGAGDAFASGFLASFIKNNDCYEALRWGIVNSAFTLEKIGGQTGLLTESKIKKNLKFAPPIVDF